MALQQLLKRCYLNKLLSTFAVIALGTSAAAVAKTIEPGLYEVEMNVESQMLPTPKIQTEQQCYTAQDLDRDPESFLPTQEDMGNDCDVGGFKFGDGRVDGVITCNAAMGKMTITFDGQYDDTSYEIVSDAQFRMGEMNMSMKTTAKAKRIGDC